MSSEQPRRARESTGSPLGSTAAIIIAIVAVVAGFLILRQINDDDDDTDLGTDSSAVGDTTGTGPATGDTSVIVPTSDATGTTLPPETTSTTVFTTEGAIVVVANASNVNRAAGTVTTALTGEGFDLVAATNATQDLDVSKVFYDSANPLAQSVATSVASLMAVAEVLPMETPPPVEGGALQGGATVLVMLGADKAAQTLEQMRTADPAATTTVAAAGAASTTTTTG